MMIVFTVLLGLIYPLIVLGVAQGLFKDKANGSQVTAANGQVVGSSLLGQTFTGERYFQGRPSAAGITASGTMTSDGKPGDAADLALSASSGSNLGPTNEKLVGACVPVPKKDADGNAVTDAQGNAVNDTNPDGTPKCDSSSVPQRVLAYRLANGLPDTATVPVDAVTSSGSGVDPMISVENANLQTARVARARGLDPAKVQSLVQAHTAAPSLGVLGEQGVNVLELNLDLDRQG
jgi:K+-transporting ATPase ATPase C chain